jgi:hypothetical protein
MLLEDMELKAMDDRASSWGDMMSTGDSISLSEELEDEEDNSLDHTLMSVWGPEGLVEVMPSFFVTSALSDASFESLMKWLCHTGWDIVDQDRDMIRIDHIEHQPSREWGGLVSTPVPVAGIPVAGIPVAGIPRDACRRCGTHHWSSKTPCPTGDASKLSKPGTDIGRREGPPVMRFCKLGKACPKAGCRYVHGDTIPRINQPCRFDGTCSGEKRATCLHMHHGETYVKGMVLKRM